ncbi:MAG: alanine:cation symporter family protein, partial [Deltaproteobacteria bacterium]|nr:alanine:cation symporter family protein [Deltaproteobacteria bacterium]
VLFAFSTMISWCYYGEQCWAKLFGIRSMLLYKGIFLGFAWFGAIFASEAVILFGDLMILGAALPNVLGVVLLSGKVRADLDDYLRRLKSGEIRPVKQE